MKNDWPAAILLKVAAADDSISVRLFSSRLGRRISSDTLGTPAEGSPLSITYTRRIARRSGAVRDERFSWSYRAPPLA